jgi:hypothetical protein
MNIPNAWHRLFDGRSKRGTGKGIRAGHLRHRRVWFEALEARQMLSITPSEFPIVGDDTTTAELLAITPDLGPEIPPFPGGLEEQIDGTL